MRTSDDRHCRKVRRRRGDVLQLASDHHCFHGLSIMIFSPKQDWLCFVQFCHVPMCIPRSHARSHVYDSNT